MKIDFKTFSDNEVVSTTKENKITLSEDSQSMFFQMFTKNIYSNPIGSVVREITSNCFDSHIEAGINAPVLIKKSFDEQTNTHYISFIDYGVGMSPARIDEVYSVMFKSTKRDDNTQIGGFGLGSKAPLAYKRFATQGEYDNSFYVITVYNGVKYYYCIYEGNESPMISLLHSESTADKNGTEVKIPVKVTDISKFTSEMIKQLYYFENVVFEGFDEKLISNEYQIVRGKNFLYRGKEYSNVIHVCLGRVAYPIDYGVLGLYADNYRIPVAIKLDIGDVNVTASRESLDYSEQTIKTLKKRIADVKAELIEMVTKQCDDIVTIKDYLKYESEFGFFRFNDKSKIDISSFIKKSEIVLTNFKYQHLHIPEESRLFKFFFQSRNFGRRVGKAHKLNFHGYYNQIITKKNLIYVEDTFKRKVSKQSYLKNLHTAYHVIEKRDILSANTINEINSVFGLKINSVYTEHDKQPLAIIETMVEMQNEYFELITEHCENYDKLEIPADFKINTYSINSKSDENLSINVRIVDGYNKRNTIELNTLNKHNGTIFYGTENDSQALYAAYRAYRDYFDSKYLIRYYNEHSGNFGDKKGGIIFLQLSKQNVKYMDGCKNAFHVNEFSDKMLSRKKDYIIKLLINNYVANRYKDLSNLFKSNELVKINSTWGNMVIMLNEYVKSISVDDDRYVNDNTKAILKLPNIDELFEIKRFNIMFNKLLKLQKSNEKMLSYFRISTNDTLDDELVKLLKHALKFKQL